MKTKFLKIIFTVLVLSTLFISYVYNKNKEVKEIQRNEFHKKNPVRNISLDDVKNYNYFLIENLAESKYLYYIFNIDDLKYFQGIKYKNLNANLILIPIFNTNESNLIKLAYCNNDNRKGVILSSIYEYNLNYYNDCDISEIIFKNEELKQLNIAKKLPILMFNDGESIYNFDYNKLNSYLEESINLINDVLELEGNKKESENFVKYLSFLSESFNIYNNQESLYKQESKIVIQNVRNITNILNKDYSISENIKKENKINKNNIKPNKKLFVYISESYPNLFRVSLYKNVPLKTIMELNHINNPNIVNKNQKIYYK